MEVTILGSRGSSPATGARFDRYGGDTSSVAVARDGQEPTVVLDAGTGLRRLGEELGARPFRGAILLTHLHWDHTHGLPFAPTVDRDDSEVDVYLPAQGVDPLALLARVMGPPHFPVRPDQMRGRWNFYAIEAGRHLIGGFEVLAADVSHKGGRTLGYRLDDGHSSVSYIPDHDLSDDAAEPADLVGGVDLLLHDAQFLVAEFPAKAHLGHSTVEAAVEFATRQGVGHLSLFHHDPSRTDSEIDHIVERLTEAPIDVSAAAAGARWRSVGIDDVAGTLASCGRDWTGVDDTTPGH